MNEHKPNAVEKESDSKKEFALFKEELNRVIESGDITLPVLPEVAGKVISLSNNEDVSIQELSDLIHKDQLIAGHVLKTANSAAYGGVRNITSLQQAASRLGVKLLAEISIAVSLQSNVFVVRGYKDIIKSLWNHSLASALFGKEIARLKKLNAEGMFITGLLHSIGMPVVLQSVHKISKREDIKLSDRNINLLIKEFHLRLTKAIMTQWDLPDIIKISTEYYLNYLNAPKYANECAMTYLANRLAIWIYDDNYISEEKILKNPVNLFLNLYPDEVQSLLEKKDEILEQVSGV